VPSIFRPDFSLAFIIDAYKNMMFFFLSHSYQDKLDD
jgi:hypothetical protein